MPLRVVRWSDGGEELLIPSGRRRTRVAAVPPAGRPRPGGVRAAPVRGAPARRRALPPLAGLHSAAVDDPVGDAGWGTHGGAGWSRGRAVALPPWRCWRGPLPR